MQMLLFLVLIGIFVSEALRSNLVSRPAQRLATIRAQAMPSFLLNALDAETLDALGDVSELNEALDNVVDSTVNPAVGVLTKLSASPAIIAVPIVAGLLVAIGFGYFIFSYGQGKDD